MSEMIQIQIVIFTGASGQDYPFAIYPIEIANYALAASGVYIVSRRDLTDEDLPDHTLLYCGTTEDLRTTFENHLYASAFSEYGANCLCFHAEDDPTTQVQIATDLIDGHAPPYNE